MQGLIFVQNTQSLPESIKGLLFMPLCRGSCQYSQYKLFIYRCQAWESLYEVTRVSDKPTSRESCPFFIFFYEVLEIFRPMENLVRDNGDTSRGRI